MRREYGVKTRYYVILFTNKNSSDVLMTSEYLKCLHDAKEFVNFVAHSFTGEIPYQIVEVSIIDGQEFEEYFPRSVMKSRALDCEHLPPMPLYMYIKKKRRKEREQQGFYYSYRI